jgi:hypothetical protein
MFDAMDAPGKTVEVARQITAVVSMVGTGVKLHCLAAISLVFFASGVPDAKAQGTSQLNKEIQTETNVLGGMIKDLGPDMGQIGSLAKQFGDPNLQKQTTSLQGSGALGMGSDALSQISALTGQISHIPGLGGIASSLKAACGTGGTQNFSKTSVVSKLLPQFGGGGDTAISSSGLLGDFGSISQALGAGSSGSSGSGDASMQSEMGQAAQVLPAAVKNMQQENQEIKQLLAE